MLFIILVAVLGGVAATGLNTDGGARAPPTPPSKHEIELRNSCEADMKAVGFHMFTKASDNEFSGHFKKQLGHIFKDSLMKRHFNDCMGSWCHATMKLVDAYQSVGSTVQAVDWAGLTWPSIEYSRQWQIYHLLEASVFWLTHQSNLVAAHADDPFPQERDVIWSRLNHGGCSGEALAHLMTQELGFVLN